MIRLILFGFAGLLSCAAAMKCNGMEGLCDLRFDQVTLAGTHNSAANKALWFADPAQTRAAACNFKNQYRGITRQLQDGIRALDIDLCYRFDKKTVWACHSTADVEPVKNILKEIANFLNKPENRNEVVFIRFHDSEVEGFGNLKRDLEANFKPDGVQMDDSQPRFPTLRDAIQSNKRIFVFAATKLCNYFCRMANPYVRSVNIYHETWDTWWSGSCYKMPRWTIGKCKSFRVYYDKPLTYVSAFGTWGACNDLVASTCNQYVKQTVMNCHSEMDKIDQTVNVIAVDYYEEGSRVVEIAKELNKINIKKFS